ncbi:MAG: hypothetical protein J4F45_03800 [Pseudomonadales bacterium]|nr:hypothetical protein [Pseudomonadales bacterium]
MTSVTGKRDVCQSTNSAAPRGKRVPVGNTDLVNQRDRTVALGFRWHQTPNGASSHIL